MLRHVRSTLKNPSRRNLLATLDRMPPMSMVENAAWRFWPKAKRSTLRLSRKLRPVNPLSPLRRGRSPGHPGKPAGRPGTLPDGPLMPPDNSGSHPDDPENPPLAGQRPPVELDTPPGAPDNAPACRAGPRVARRCPQNPGSVRRRGQDGALHAPLGQDDRGKGTVERNGRRDGGGVNASETR